MNYRDIETSYGKSLNAVWELNTKAGECMNINASVSGMNAIDCCGKIASDIVNMMKPFAEKESVRGDRSKTTPKILPVPAYIVQDHAATIVHWEDGTYTSVVCGAEDEPNVYAAYCAAFQKKLLGSTSAVHKLVDRHLDKNIKAKREEEARKHKAEQEEREKINHDRKVRELAKEMQLQREAIGLMWSELADLQAENG